MKKPLIRRLLLAAAILLVALIAVIWCLFSEKHDDIAAVKANYIVEAIPFIKEYEKDYKAANKKYAEKIIEVKGLVTEIKAPDTTINIIMADTLSGSYLIFAFQEQHLAEAKTIQPGNIAVIKGSCSDGVYSEILGKYFISFKRSMLKK